MEAIGPSEMSEQTMQTGQCKTPKMTPIWKTEEVIAEQQQKDKKVRNNSRRQTHSFGNITVMFCLPYIHIKQSAGQYGHIKLSAGQYGHIKLSASQYGHIKLSFLTCHSYS
jgi:hypothetical protein